MQDGKPAAPVPAATVILTRQQAGELQVYLLKRNIKSGFMAGNYVFPGGVVDPEDRDYKGWRANLDLTPGGIERHLGKGLSTSEAFAYAIAAIRETFEEAGVLLAKRGDGQTALDTGRLCALRISEALPRGWLKRQATTEGWILELRALSRWSHWITPERMKRRYDTRFFLAFMLPGQVCRPDGKETVNGIWINPEKGLAANLTGEIPLSPPTLVTLHELLTYSCLADLQEQAENRPWGDERLPRLVPLKKGMVIVEPWDRHYRQGQIKINADTLHKMVLPVGEPFSRLWYNDGLWKPVET